MAASQAIEALPFNINPSKLFAVVSLFVIVAALLLLLAFFTAQKHFWIKYDHLSSFCTFFYSTFLIPHSQDEGSGQQAALESFYKVQVASTEELAAMPCIEAFNRPMSTMPLAKSCYVVAKICWPWLPLS